MDQETYISVLRIVKSHLGKRKLNFINAEDVIADTIILDGSMCLDKKQFLKKCNIIIIEKIREKHYSNKLVYHVPEKKCERCKEVLPIGMFGITKVYRYNGEYYNSYRKPCVNKHVAEWYQKQKSDPKKYEDYKKRVNKFKKEWRNRRKLAGLKFV